MNKIVSLSLRRKDNDLLVLSIWLPESVRLEYLYQASAKRELDQLLDQFRELTTGRKIEATDTGMGARIQKSDKLASQV